MTRIVDALLLPMLALIGLPALGLVAMVITLLLVSRFGRSSRDSAATHFEGPGQ